MEEFLSNIKNFNFTKAKKLIGSLNLSTSDNLNDKALFYKLVSLVNHETGNIKESQNTMTSLISLVDKNFSVLDPLSISSRMDNIIISSKTAKNLSNFKNLAMEELAKSQLTNNPYLITKGYLTLSNIYNMNYNFTTASALHSLAIDNFCKHKLKSEILFYEIIKQNSLMDKTKLKKLLKEHPVNNKKLLNLLKYNDIIINTRSTFYDNVTVLDSILSNDTEDLTSIKTYLKKYILFETNHRSATSEYYKEKALEVLGDNYSKDSTLYIDYYLRLIFENLDKMIEKGKIEKSITEYGDFINRNNLGYLNVYQIAFIYNKLLFAIIFNEGIHEITKRYGEFYNAHKNLIGDESDHLFSLNMLMKSRGYSAIYKSFIDKK